MATYHFRDVPLDTDQGVEWRHSLSIEDDSGDPLDLTGYTWAMKGRRSFGAADPALFSISTGSGITDSTGSDGLIDTILITDDTLAGISPAQNLVWELRGSNGSGDGEITIKGPWQHHPGAI